MAFWAVVFVIGTAIALFLTIGVASLLLKSMAAHWVYICIAAFYIVVLAIVAALRHRLFVDPIARFVSRLILDPKAFSSSSSSAADSTLSSTDSTASLSDTNL
jgi:Na+/H+-dicarboxylate symporter